MPVYPSPPPSLLGSEISYEGMDGSFEGRSSSRSSASFSTFSLTSSMESQIFREDGGRRFQAANDEYNLPADDSEFARLDLQHFGFKTFNNGKNYLAPVAEALKPGSDGRRKRALDIGTGSGIWAIEMAQEFPDVDWIACDLFPIEKDFPIPTNLSFVQADATKPMDFPDSHFDLVHTRALLGGIRDWPWLVEETIRITRPGGLVYFVENAFPWLSLQSVPGTMAEVAPGFAGWHELLMHAIRIRGMDWDAGSKTIPRLMRSHDLVEGFGQQPTLVHLTPCSNVAHERQAGELMRQDMLTVPDACKLLVLDSTTISEEAFEQAKAGWVHDLMSNAPVGLPMYHNWGWKKV